MSSEINLRDYVKAYMDFPKKGVNFYDATELLKNPDVFNLTIKEMARLAEAFKPDRIVAIDSKGFLFGSAVAVSLNLGLSLIRKKNKLPNADVMLKYELEYSTDTIEIRKSDFNKNERVVIVDDVLASGGTLSAGVDILKKNSINVVGTVVAIEIGFLNGRNKVASEVSSLLYYEK